MSFLALCVLNSFLSFTAFLFNIVTINAIKKTSSLSKNLKTLLLTLAISDLGVGLLAQPMYVTQLIMKWKQHNENDSLYIGISNAHLILTNILPLSRSMFWHAQCCVQKDSWPFVYPSDTRNL